MLIQPSMAKILAHESKKTTCMHARLCALVMLLAQKWPEYYPQSIDTLIFLIWPILLIYGSKYSMLGHNHVCLDHIMCSDLIDMFSWFWTYLDLSDLIQFGWDIALCVQKHSVHANYFVCLGHMCSDNSSILPWFHRHLYITNPTKYCNNMGPCTQENSRLAC